MLLFTSALFKQKQCRKSLHCYLLISILSSLTFSYLLFAFHASHSTLILCENLRFKFCANVFALCWFVISCKGFVFYSCNCWNFNFNNIISTPREPPITRQTLVSSWGCMSSWLLVGVEIRRGQPIKGNESKWQKTFAA